MSKLQLLTSEVEDKYAQENFRQISELVRKNPLVYGDFVVKEITFSKAVTDQEYPHGLTFVPQDVIVLRKTGAGDISIGYAKFTKDNLYFTTTGACQVRLLVGTARGDQ
jgi:hypothetical protein